MAKVYYVDGSPDFMKVYQSLPQGSRLKRSIDDAMDELKKNPLKGDKIQKRLWPTEYIKKYQIDNLFRYPLVDAWRLTYTITTESRGTVSVILDALDHPSYDRLFGY